MCWMQMIEVQDLFRHALIRHFQGRNAAEQLPEVFISLFIQHPSAAAYKAILHTAGTVVAAAENMHAFNNVNMFPVKVSIANQVGRTCHTRQPAADKINLLIAVISRLDFFVYPALLLCGLLLRYLLGCEYGSDRCASCENT